MEQQSRPRVSIGTPVYNGERYLARAIDSVLNQTFRDFELVICDNASTDRTEAICRSYVERDDRVRYFRKDRNLGAAPNFNRTYHMSTGEYFKWHAHDDALEPTYLERCVALLDANPDAVLCQSGVAIIDENGDTLDIYRSDLPALSSDRVSDRFAGGIFPHKATDFYGLVRRSALEGTLLHADFPGADRVLIVVLALRGRFLRIDEPLFLNRNHPEQYQRAIRLPDRQAWHNSSKTGPLFLPTLRVYLHYLREMRAQVTDPGERWRCYFHLLRWWTYKSPLKSFFFDLLVAVMGPQGWSTFRSYTSRLKRRLLPLLRGKVF